jgi:putative DNA primase/helicase
VSRPTRPPDYAQWVPDRQNGWLLENDPELARMLGLVPADNGEDQKQSVDPPPEFSDEALALSFAERHAADLRFVAVWNKWLRWDGSRWRLDNTLHALTCARRVCREEAAACTEPNIAVAIASAKTVAAVERLSRADPRLAATVEQWDVEPWLINTPGGVVDLRTGKTCAHSADDYMTMITAVAPGGDCPEWKAFLHRIMGQDAEAVAYLKRVCGYCLTGDTSEQAIFFAYGCGQNGKGVFLQTIGRIMGDYCKTAAIETFTESKADRHPTELARLHNARLVTASETEGGKHWAESRLKMLTGGDSVTAHFMRKDDFEYIPRFKPFFSGNHKPGLRNVGVAMRRRVTMIPFPVTIPEKERDKWFSEKLKSEWPGILAWMIEGCLEWQKLGLAAPEIVTNATADYFMTQDSLLFWLEECCERDPNAETSSIVLFSSWKGWADKAGVRHGDIKTFGDAMAEKGFERKHTKKGNVYRGVCMRPDPAIGKIGEAR